MKPNSLAATQPPPEPSSRATRKVGVWLMGWTLFVLVAVGVLAAFAASDLATPILVQREAEGEVVSAGDRCLRWLLLVHLSSYRFYPWILLAPYLVWFTSHFPFERSRLLTSVPAQLVACAASVAGAVSANRIVGAQQPDVIVLAVSETRQLQGTNGFSIAFAAGGSASGLPVPPGFPAGVPDPMKLEALLQKPGAGLAGTPRTGQHRATGPLGSLVIERDDRVAAVGAPADTNRLGAGMATTRTTFELKQRRRLGGAPDFLGPQGMSEILFHLMAYGSMVGLAHAAHFRRRCQERERRAIGLEASLARTRLHALQAQLHPHFLFNALNSVIALVRQNPRAAEEMLVSLGDLLRLALSQSQHQETPLAEELRFLDLYLEIQRMRFGDRLRYETDVPAEARACRIPTLLLQPLVENAIRHGIEPAGRPGCVRVSAHLRLDCLELEVRDDGVGLGLSPGHPPRFGVGLSNVRARLDSFFGSAARVRLTTPPGGGCCVTIAIPAPVETHGGPLAPSEIPGT